MGLLPRRGAWACTVLLSSPGAQALAVGAAWDPFLRRWARPSPPRTGERRWHERGVNKHTEPPDSYNQVV